MFALTVLAGEERSIKTIGKNLEEKLCVVKVKSDCAEQSFKGTSGSLINLNGMKFKSSKFTQAKLDYVSAKGTDFQDADFTDAEIEHSHLDRIIGRGANFYHTKISDSSFKGASLAKANFSKSALTHVDMSGARLPDAKLNNAQIVDLNLVSSNAARANFAHAHIEGVNFKRAKLSSAQFECAVFAGSIQLEGASLGQANFNGIRMTHAKLSDLDQKQVKQRACFAVDTEGELHRSSSCEGQKMLDCCGELAEKDICEGSGQICQWKQDKCLSQCTFSEKKACDSASICRWSSALNQCYAK